LYWLNALILIDSSNLLIAEMNATRTVITGTGAYIPEDIKSNKDFVNNEFYDEHFNRIQHAPDVIVEKFKQITGIEERRYAPQNLNASALGALAAQKAIMDAGIDPETIDQIIVSHTCGDVDSGTCQADFLPALASRVKHHLGIANPNCVAYDVIFGCPGWIQGMIQADAFIKAGMAKRCLVIGAETLSRVIDHHDRDSMIFSDGAGACIVEAKADTESGILAYAAQSHSEEELSYLYMGKTYLPDSDSTVKYLKMKGRKVYEYAMSWVPAAMKSCIDKAGLDITDIKKFFLHQANEKMDFGFVKALYNLYGIKQVPTDVLPMNIHKLGNSSVATVPTLYDMVLKGELAPHQVEKGDVVMFASVGAGMNINAMCYRV
jgi:3-oxoacyl-[acyl-carrier-protein] synthase III